ncbi:Fe/S biogenesis protein NfuA [Candidatus Poribacteria bacterium]|jgi:Fe/S biogenesis protein NfuA|nr:Fe/S biogenesis protein NfuA [Candidatus Poribacteria bacterium]MBF74384.1 Fe/S biogenesis protein NfuA [Candidatus Poribacteria bacterium]OUT63289.1 MAG: Fe/S biogenesis protein NfuA [bacterium TMED15]|tara:strand:- start:254 stop:871 length:618 start_codon:yes stop_codon:yes gene_type:complete
MGAETRMDSTNKETTTITLTEAAAEKVQAIIEQESYDEIAGLRISISGQKANEFEYALGLEVEARPDDLVIESKGVKVLVDPASFKNLGGAALDYVDDLNASGFRVDNPNQPTWEDPRAQEIQLVIDNQINPSVASHGGYIQLLDVQDETIYVHMGGGCQGCGMAQATLKQGVERIIKDHFPEINHVIDTTDHAAGTNPYYQSEF